MIQKGSNINLIWQVMFFCLFFILFKNTPVLCDERFLKSIFIDGKEILATKSVTLSQAINSQINLINFWKPPTNFNILWFNQLNNSAFFKHHPLAHPNLLLFTDELNKIHITSQITKNPPLNSLNFFTFLSEFDLNGQSNLQFIWKNPGLISFDDVIISSKHYVPQYLDCNVRKHVINIMIKQNLNPHFMNVLLK